VRTTGKKRSESCNANESFHDVTSELKLARYKTNRVFIELMVILPLQLSTTAG
jgi:hypothetical protein